MFDKLDTDHDGTLDRKRLGHRVTDAEFKAANPDKDGTLDKAEYRGIVEQRYKAANPDSDGTLDVKELGTPAGRHLLRILHEAARSSGIRRQVSRGARPARASSRPVAAPLPEAAQNRQQLCVRGRARI